MQVRHFYTCFLSNCLKQVFLVFVGFVFFCFKLLIASYPKLLAKGWAKHRLFFELCYFYIPLKEHCYKNTKAIFPSWGLLSIVPHTFFPLVAGSSPLRVSVWLAITYKRHHQYKNKSTVTFISPQKTFVCPANLCQIVARWCTPVSKISQICSKQSRPPLTLIRAIMWLNFIQCPFLVYLLLQTWLQGNSLFKWQSSRFPHLRTMGSWENSRHLGVQNSRWRFCL